MPSEGVEVQGLRKLVRALEQAGVEVADLKDAFGEIANDAARIAASLAPRRSGRLAASIKGSRAKNKAVIRAGSARVPYASVIEYGWPRRGIEGSHYMERAAATIAPTLAPRLDAAIRRLLASKGL